MSRQLTAGYYAKRAQLLSVSMEVDSPGPSDITASATADTGSQSGESTVVEDGAAMDATPTSSAVSVIVDGRTQAHAANTNPVVNDLSTDELLQLIYPVAASPHKRRKTDSAKSKSESSCAPRTHYNVGDTPQEARAQDLMEFSHYATIKNIPYSHDAHELDTLAPEEEKANGTEPAKLGEYHMSIEEFELEIQKLVDRFYETHFPRAQALSLMKNAMDNVMSQNMFRRNKIRSWLRRMPYVCGLDGDSPIIQQARPYDSLYYYDPATRKNSRVNYQCVYCNVIGERVDLRRHEALHEQKGHTPLAYRPHHNKIFLCSRQCMTHMSRVNAKRHVFIEHRYQPTFHSNPRPEYCPLICPEVYSHYSSLRTHQQVHDDHAEVSPFEPTDQSEISEYLENFVALHTEQSLNVLPMAERRQIFDEVPDPPICSKLAIEMIVNNENFPTIMKRIPQLQHNLRRTILPEDLKIAMPEMFPREDLQRAIAHSSNTVDHN